MEKFHMGTAITYLSRIKLSMRASTVRQAARFLRYVLIGA